MSRIRSIHPGLWTDEAFVSLSAMSRLLIMGIWNECDDMGIFAWSPLTLKMRILPADNADAAELLAEMVGAGIVLRYEVAGKSYGAVRNFCKFQRPKKPNAVHPQTDEVREWVNIEARSTRDGSEEVGNQLPTGGEKSRQMEDGGDKGIGKRKVESQPSLKSEKPSPREKLPDGITSATDALNYVCAEAQWCAGSDTQRQAAISTINGWLALGCTVPQIIDGIAKARRRDPSPTRSLKRFDSTIRGMARDRCGGELPVTRTDVHTLTIGLAQKFAGECR